MSLVLTALDDIIPTYVQRSSSADLSRERVLVRHGTHFGQFAGRVPNHESREEEESWRC
jgi:hypothetical protein